MSEIERDLLIAEIVAYYKLYDFHDVWKPAGARALVDWLAARGYVLCAAPATPGCGRADNGEFVADTEFSETGRQVASRSSENAALIVAAVNYVRAVLRQNGESG